MANQMTSNQIFDNNLKQLSILGKLSENELKVIKHDKNIYVIFNTYVFTLDNFIALVIFIDTIKECSWQKYNYLVAGGTSLRDSLIEVFNQAESLYNYDNATDKLLTNINSLSNFYNFIQALLHAIHKTIPNEIVLSTKNDVYLNILIYIEYLTEELI